MYIIFNLDKKIVKDNIQTYKQLDLFQSFRSGPEVRVEEKNSETYFQSNLIKENQISSRDLVGTLFKKKKNMK